MRRLIGYTEIPICGNLCSLRSALFVHNTCTRASATVVYANAEAELEGNAPHMRAANAWYCVYSVLFVFAGMFAVFVGDVVALFTFFLSW